LATQARDRNNGNLNDGMDHRPSIIAKFFAKFKLVMSPIIGDPLDLNLPEGLFQHLLPVSENRKL
jgi:hypothetical protein